MLIPTFVASGPSEGLKIRGCQYYLVGIICPPLVEIGLTDLPKSGGAMANPGTTRDERPDVVLVQFS